VVANTEISHRKARSGFRQDLKVFPHRSKRPSTAAEFARSPNGGVARVTFGLGMKGRYEKWLDQSPTKALPRPAGVAGQPFLAQLTPGATTPGRFVFDLRVLLRRPAYSGMQVARDHPVIIHLGLAFSPCILNRSFLIHKYGDLLHPNPYSLNRIGFMTRILRAPRWCG